MSRTIALAGKGGTGKTTISALIIRQLKKRGKSPILAVDADPAANLPESLGLQVKETVGSVQAEFHKSIMSIPPGMPKSAYLELRLNQILVESEGLDLLVMGRPEGPGCYCASNDILRNFLDMLSDNYDYIVIDNEAGMEHLSRRTTRDVDVLLIVSDPTVKGIRTARKIVELARELELPIGKKYMIIDRADWPLNGTLEGEMASTGVDLLGVVPYDVNVVDFDLKRRSLLDLPDDSPAIGVINGMLDKLEI